LAAGHFDAIESETERVSMAIPPINGNASGRADSLGINVRYQMAWTEIATRIAQRQNALYLYLAISGALLGFCVQDPVLHFVIDGRLVDQVSRGRLLAQLFGAAGIPLAGKIFAELNRKHEGTIRLLRSFLEECEERVGSENGRPPLTYNSSPRYRVRANELRELHDRVFCSCIMFFGIAAFVSGIFIGHRFLPEVLVGSVLAGYSVLWGIIIAVFTCDAIEIVRREYEPVEPDNGDSAQ
jgi:hypothetical protein